MAFGQQAGPPATARQVRELLELLIDAGHADFRDARGPMGFNQRQASGKFTRDEADSFIEQLQQEAEGGGGRGGDAGSPTSEPRSSEGPAQSTKGPAHSTKSAAQNTKGPAQNTKSVSARTPARPVRTPIPKARQKESGLSHVSDADLAAELQRRGWIVVEP